MTISSVGAVSNAASQLLSVGAKDHDKDDAATSNAGAAPAKANDGDGDDRRAAATTIARSSAPVQEALANLTTGG